jgi:threonine dehydratase
MKAAIEASEVVTLDQIGPFCDMASPCGAGTETFRLSRPAGRDHLIDNDAICAIKDIFDDSARRGETIGALALAGRSRPG